MGGVATACTYGPAESHARVVQVVRVGTGPRALVVVQHDVTEAPTGLGSFPDGGRARVPEQVAILYEIDGIERGVREVLRHTPPDEQWESFNAWVGGITPTGTAYLRFSGCPRSGECHPDLTVTSYYGVTPGGLIQPVPEMPDDAWLAGSSLAPMEHEAVYLRYGIDEAGVTVLSVAGGDPTLAFRLDPEGGLTPVEGG